MKIEMVDDFDGRKVTASFSVGDLEMMTEDELQQWTKLKASDILFQTYILSLRIEKRKGEKYLEKIIR